MLCLITFSVLPVAEGHTLDKYLLDVSFLIIYIHQLYQLMDLILN